MYVIGSSGKDVNEYNLSTGFDISTATYAQNFSVSNEDTSPQEVVFNHDGTKMFIVGLSSDAVYQYNLTTGFDISTATYAQNISVDDANPSGLAFNNDGTKLFVVGHAGDSVYEYSLDNPAVQTVALNSAITTFLHSIQQELQQYNRSYRYWQQPTYQTVLQRLGQTMY